MPLEKTFRQLAVQLRRFRERIRELEITVVEDRPQTRDAAIVDNFECAVDDLTGWAKESLDQAEEAERAIGHPPDVSAARHALASCQELYQRMERVFSANLVSYERVSDLTKFGSERRGEWPSWVTSVKQGIDHCRHPLEEAGKALADCWQEIAEHAGMNSVSVRNMNIGQKIGSDVVDRKKAAPERLT
jgi:hypothetical protein